MYPDVEKTGSVGSSSLNPEGVRWNLDSVEQRLVDDRLTVVAAATRNVANVATSQAPQGQPNQSNQPGQQRLAA